MFCFYFMSGPFLHVTWRDLTYVNEEKWKIVRRSSNVHMHYFALFVGRCMHVPIQKWQRVKREERWTIWTKRWRFYWWNRPAWIATNNRCYFFDNAVVLNWNNHHLFLVLFLQIIRLNKYIDNNTVIAVQEVVVRTFCLLCTHHRYVSVTPLLFVYPCHIIIKVGDVFRGGIPSLKVVLVTRAP